MTRYIKDFETVSDEVESKKKAAALLSAAGFVLKKQHRLFSKKEMLWTKHYFQGSDSFVKFEVAGKKNHLEAFVKEFNENGKYRELSFESLTPTIRERGQSALIELEAFIQEFEKNLME